MFSGQGVWIWTWDPSILIGLALWTTGYCILAGPLRRKKGWNPLSRARQASFHCGTLIVFISLVSPLDHLSDAFLLSAHMIQHLLLLIAAPPLWLLGMPGEWLDSIRYPGLLVRAFRWLTGPITAFIFYNAILFTWHIPALYNTALYYEPVHIVEHLSYLAAAIVGWWPILGFLPRTAPRPGYPVQLFYLFFMMGASSLLGALIVLSRTPIYSFYVHTPGVINGVVLSLSINGPRLWNLSVMDDQQVAGLIMWIPGNMVYFTGLMVIFGRWFKSQE